MSTIISKNDKRCTGGNEAIVIAYCYSWFGSLQHNSLCFLSNDNNHDKSFLYQVQTILVDYLEDNHPHVKKTNLLF